MKNLRHTDSDMSILVRRTSTLGHMKMLVSNPENWVLDSTLFGIVVAGIAEARLGDLAVARKHSNAALALLSLRNGLKTIQEIEFPTGVIILYAFVTLGGTQLFSNPSRLRTASAGLRHRLRNFQNWNREIRTQVAMDFNHPLKKDTPIPGILWYFGSSSVLRPYVESSFANQQPNQLRSYLAVVYTINSML